MMEQETFTAVFRKVEIVDGQVFSVRDVARRLMIAERTARRLILSGALHAHRAGRAWRIPEQSLVEYIRSTSNRRCDIPQRGSDGA